MIAYDVPLGGRWWRRKAVSLDCHSGHLMLAEEDQMLSSVSPFLN